MIAAENLPLNGNVFNEALISTVNSLYKDPIGKQKYTLFKKSKNIYFKSLPSKIILLTLLVGGFSH